MSAADVIEEAIQGTLHEDLDVYIPECMWVAEAVLAALSAAGYVVATPEEIRAWPVERVEQMRPKAAEPPTVDGHTHRCPAPGYAGWHTAVGAGAVSSPYRCHGCGAWFTLDDEVRDDV